MANIEKVTPLGHNESCQEAVASKDDALPESENHRNDGVLEV